MKPDATINMKTKILTFAACASVTVLAANLQANSVELYANAYEYGGGGEATAVTTPSYLANYAPSAIISGGFETFCLEVAVDVSVGTPYSYTLGQTTSEGTTLSLGAAYLYYLFGTGELGTTAGSPAYNYANIGGTRIQDAELMQTAIWALMDQPNYFGQEVDTDPYYEFTVATFGANVLNPSDGAYGVDVMQLWDPNNVGSPAPYGYQAQLVLIPDGGSTVLLLGAGFGLLALAGRRKSWGFCSRHINRSSDEGIR